MGLAEKRKAVMDEVTRQELCKAASRIIGTHGIAGLTMALVADEAGVSKGTLYNYFKDKNELVFRVILSSFTPLIDQLDEIADADVRPPEQLRDVLHALLSRVEDNQSIILMASESLTSVSPSRITPEVERMRLRVERVLSRVFKRGADQGLFRGDPSINARLLLAMLFGLVQPRLHDRTDRSVDDEVRDMLSLVLDGITVRD